MSEKKKARIFYFRLPEDWTRQQKYAFLDEKQSIYNIEWQEITPDAKNNWLTEGMHDEFETFLPMGNKETKSSKKDDIETIFKTYSNGIKTNRDNWAFNFNQDVLTENIKRSIDFYNEQVFKWLNSDRQTPIDDFVGYEPKKISWSRDLKQDLNRGKVIKYEKVSVRQSLYRPFTKQHLYFDNTHLSKIKLSVF